MSISNFDDLLLAACQQPQGQRLLLVFACAELPDDATPQQRAEFAQGEGGALMPAMCVDQTPDEIGNFERLAHAASQFGHPWRVVFASTLAGQGETPPTSQVAEPMLERMVEAIKLGSFANMIAFDATGQAISLA